MRLASIQIQVFVSQCIAEKNSYLPRHAPVRLGMSRLRSSVTSSFADFFHHVPTSRIVGWNDFLRGLASSISPNLSIRFGTFPAVYRAPGPSRHQPGYVFPGVHGQVRLPCGGRPVHNPVFRFTREGIFTASLRMATVPTRRPIKPWSWTEQNLFRFTFASSAWPGFFFPQDIAIQTPDSFFRIYRMAERLRQAHLLS